jgi:hypothetical protein
MIAEGKSNIEWERKVPAEKIQDLKDLLSADDFDTNLPTVLALLREYRFNRQYIYSKEASKSLPTQKKKYR